ncbi:hypothetical protein IFM89_021648 [Coptis chinensis]|uniref:RNase H type-1 domain-containing protein n=1 Tax=Coptis chinensis TaxID=261450 RepID=A0A835IEB4_9MAGN|nr:hypothetical protein IFM89_021648 [Coptis chinensis]
MAMVDFKQNSRTIFDIKRQQPISTYLGNPTCLSRVTSKSFNPLLLRLQNRLRLWKTSTLSLSNGACHENPGPAGLGCVLRNYEGGFVAASVDYVPIRTSFLAEALAMRLGLYLAISYSITHIHIQSDSPTLISCIKGEDNDSPWEAAGIIEDIR